MDSFKQSGGATNYPFFEYGGFSNTSSREECRRNRLIKGIALSKITFEYTNRGKLILTEIVLYYVAGVGGMVSYLS